MSKTVIYDIPASMTRQKFHYCPGCGHSIIHKLLGEVIDELNIADITIGVAPVGCAVNMYDYFNIDMTEAAHGRPPAVATGIKRVRPDRIVFTYQGDGDLAAIGTAELIHCANRGENISIIFVNNTVYGMTGGQMAPTTMPGQKTLTTPNGRDVNSEGKPIHVVELLNTLDSPVFLARSAVNDIKGIVTTKKYIKNALQIQIDKIGFSLVEILSQCPTNWGVDPLASNKRIEDIITKEFPLGVIRDKRKEEK